MKKTEFEKAYDYACLLLKYRDRLKNEIINRLKEKNFSEGIINKVIEKLEQQNYLNDIKFVDEFIVSQIKKGKSLTFALYLLKNKFNIDPPEEIKNKFDDYRKLQYEQVITLLKRKFRSKLSLVKTDGQVYISVLNFLLKKGYTEQEIEKILNSI